MLAESYNHQQGEGGEILERLEAANIDRGDIILQVQSLLPQQGSVYEPSNEEPQFIYKKLLYWILENFNI